MDFQMIMIYDVIFIKIKLLNFELNLIHNITMNENKVIYCKYLYLMYDNLFHINHLEISNNNLIL